MQEVSVKTRREGGREGEERRGEERREKGKGGRERREEGEREGGYISYRELVS